MNEDEKIGTTDVSDSEIKEDYSLESNLNAFRGEESLDKEKSDGAVGNKFIAYFIIGVVALIFAVYLVQYIYNPDLHEGVTGAVVSKLDYPHDESIKDGEYNGFSFKRDELWKVEVPGIFDGKKVVFDVEFYYSPWEMKDVSIVGDFGPRFANDTVIASFDSRQENLSLMAVANGQIVKMLQKTFGKNVVGACGFNETESGEAIVGCEDRPIVDCTNTEYPLFYLKYGPSSKVEFRDNCVIIEGDGWGLVRSAEAVMMKGYSILE